MTAAPSIAGALEPLRDDPKRSAVLLDVDGVLAPIVRHASDAYVPESTRSLLIPISRAYGLVACVSGRRAADARRVVSIGSITYIGAHGSEILRPGATEAVIDDEVGAWTERIQRFAHEVETDTLRRLRVRVEDKATIVAFHWRGAPDEEAAKAAVDGVAERAEEAGLEPHWGRKVLEVRPPVRFDKGVGVERLLRGADVDVALYVGDDNTDLDAFRALRDLVADGELRQAIRVGVRSEEGPSEITAQADLVVDGTDGVRSLLEALVRLPG